MNREITFGEVKKYIDEFKTRIGPAPLAENATLATLINQIQEFVLSKENRFKEIPDALQPLSTDTFNPWPLELMDFLSAKGYLTKWVEAFRDPEGTKTADFWNSPFQQIFSGLDKLILQGVKYEVATQLRQSCLLKWYYGCMKDAAIDYDILYAKLIAIPHYKHNASQLELWELLCLSGKPEALSYAFRELHITSETVNRFGETPVHIAALGNSRKQVKKALMLGCKLEQIHDVGLLNKFKNTPKKVPVFIDLAIDLVYLGRKRTPEEFEEYGTRHINEDEISGQSSAIFPAIARRLTCSLAHGKIQAAESPEEVTEILAQHSFYKHGKAYYAVQVLVDANDLVGPCTENDMLLDTVCTVNGWRFEPANTNKWNEHWVLKSNVQIKPDDIVSITLLETTNRASFNFVKELVNPHTASPDTSNPYTSDSLRQRLNTFLSDDAFWKAHVYRVFSSRPFGVRQMQALCANESTFRIEHFHSIAKDNIPQNTSGWTGYAYSFFQPDVFTRAFYIMMSNAKNLYDVVQWIDKHYPSMTNTLELRPSVSLA